MAQIKQLIQAVTQDRNHSRKSRNATKMAFLTKKSIIPKLKVSKSCVHVIQKFYDLLLFNGCYYLNHKIPFNLIVQVAIILVFHEPFMMLFHILRCVLDHEWESDDFLILSSVEANGVTNKKTISWSAAKVWEKNKTHSKISHSQKTYNFFPILMKLGELITSWVDFFHQVSWRLDKKCGFFINRQFSKVSRFFLLRL